MPRALHRGEPEKKPHGCGEQGGAYHDPAAVFAPQGEPACEAELEEASAFDGQAAALARGPQPVPCSATIPPQFLAGSVVNECRRSIDSLWSQMLASFDATVIGRTATPAATPTRGSRTMGLSKDRHEGGVHIKVNGTFWVERSTPRPVSRAPRGRPSRAWAPRSATSGCKRQTGAQ